MGAIMVPEIDSFNGREIDNTIWVQSVVRKKDGVHDDNDHESRDGARIFHRSVQMFLVKFMKELEKHARRSHPQNSGNVVLR